MSPRLCAHESRIPAAPVNLALVILKSSRSADARTEFNLASITSMVRVTVDLRAVFSVSVADCNHVSIFDNKAGTSTSIRRSAARCWLLDTIEMQYLRKSITPLSLRYGQETSAPLFRFSWYKALLTQKILDCLAAWVVPKLPRRAPETTSFLRSMRLDRNL